MKGMRFLPVVAILIFCACGAAVEDESKAVGANDSSLQPISSVTSDTSKTAAKIKEQIIHGKDTLVIVNKFDKRIFWELKYATTDNFMHRVLYDTLKTVYVQIGVARRLAKCQQYLSKQDSSLHLLVYDGLRPLSVQWEMWKALDTIPVAERGKFVSNPKNGSVHNYGAAVDITICKTNRTPLDMGAGYDDIRKIAYPSLEAEFLAKGLLTKKHIDNRKLLRKTMSSQSFINIPTEWWHFNAFKRDVVKAKYQIVRNEL